MQTLMTLVVATVLASTSLAIAQTSPPASPPATAPSATAPPAMSGPARDLMLTEEQAKTWVGKSVYSSDGKNLGEVAAVARDASGRVTEVHADIGGFLGIGETRVRILPTQFTSTGDRITVSMTGDQAKTLPPIAKK